MASFSMERFILIALIREQLEFRTNSRGKLRWYEWVGNARDVKYSSIRPRIAGKHFWKIVYWEAGFLHILLRSIHFLVTISLSTGANELFLVQFMLFNPFPGNDEPVSGSEESKSTSNGLPVLTAPDLVAAASCLWRDFECIFFRVEFRVGRKF